MTTGNINMLRAEGRGEEKTSSRKNEDALRSLQERERKREENKTD